MAHDKQGQQLETDVRRARRDSTAVVVGTRGGSGVQGQVEVVPRRRGLLHSPPFNLLSNDGGLQVLIGLLVLAFAVSTIVVNRNGGFNPFWDGWEENIAFMLPIIPMLRCARRSPALATAWRFMASGVALNEIGSLIYTFHSQNVGQSASAGTSAAANSSLFTLVTIIDVSSYLAFIIGVTLLTQGKLGRVNASLRLDGVIAGLALASLAGVLWFQRLLTMGSLQFQVIAGMAYPLCDLVLLVLLVAGIVSNRHRPNWSTALLTVGVLWFIVGDIISLNQAATNSYVGGTFLDATWVIGIWLMGLAASAGDRRRSEAPRVPSTQSLGMTLIPVASGVISVAVIGEGVYYSNLSPVVSFLALFALLLVIVRMWMTLFEERRSVANFQDARTDALTGLPNRRSFLEQVQVQLDKAGDLIPGLILIDLNGFKEVNDALGHIAGDELLCVLGRRFEARLEGRGMLARLGGDEFAFTDSVKSVDELIEISHDLLDALVDPCVLDGVSVRVGASMGVAVASGEGATSIELLRNADVAMYDAKRMQSGTMVYRSESDPNSREQLALLGDLREAIEARSLTLHYQPTLDMRTGEVRGVEALARWQHPVLGMLQPDTFIPMAERAGLMPQLTRAILDQAVTEAVRLDRTGHPLHMSVNISRYDLVDEKLPDYIDSVLKAHGFPAERLTLEITESTLGSDPDRAAQCVSELRSRGIRISIDDFGVGYSSMSQLLGLAIDELKIDKSFIIGLCDDSRAQAIVRSAIELASALDLSLVAEGIEDKAILQSLQVIGADIGQGFFIALPLASDQLDDFLAAPEQQGQLLLQSLVPMVNH